MLVDVCCSLNLLACIQVVVAERLRGWIRNPLGFPRVGLNPADNVPSLLRVAVCSTDLLLYIIRNGERSCHKQNTCSYLDSEDITQLVCSLVPLVIR